MAGALGNVACIAAAVLASARGADFGAGRAPGLSLNTGKFIGGVPVLNYHRAYKGDTRSMSVLSEGEDSDSSTHEEAWIVVLRRETTNKRIQSICEQASGGCSSWGHEGVFPFIALSGTEKHLAEAVGPHRDVAEFIELDFKVSLDPMEEENDPLQPLDDGESSELASWGLERVGVPTRWSQGAGVHVYVCDTGIRTDHVDFGGRASAFADSYTLWPHQTVLCSDSDDPDCAQDVRGHGTHCAGTAVGTIYGVAPEANVHAVKILNNTGSGDLSLVLGGLDLVGTSGQMPAVVSMSLGFFLPASAFEAAINVLVDLGIPVVVSAGNNFRDACIKSPAAVSSAITVGSTDIADSRSSFSNFGVCVDIWAPGSDILSADGRGETLGNDANRSISGTSMACPHVAGAAALLLSANPQLTVAEVKAAMRANASINYLTGLSPTDQYNQLIYVGDPSQAPQPEVPQGEWPSDEFFVSCEGKGDSGPVMPYAVCECGERDNGAQCYEGSTLGCRIGTLLGELQEERGNSTNFSLNYYEWNCTDCSCHLEPPPPLDNDGLIFMVLASIVGLLLLLLISFIGVGGCSQSHAQEISSVSGVSAVDIEIADK